MKQAFLILLLCISGEISSNTGACSNNVEKLFSRSTYLERHRIYIHKRQNASSTDDLIAIEQNELQTHLAEGAKSFKNGESFVFKDNLQELNNTSGNRRVATYRVIHQGKSLFIKQIQYKEEAELIEDILMSGIIYELGLGPKTNLVKINDNYFLVMEDLPGVNIKEILYPEMATTTTKSKIDELLGIESANLDDAIKAFSNALIRSDDFIARLASIEQILKANGFYNVDDLQFMVDPKNIEDSLKLIDVESFERNDLVTTSAHSPEKILSGIINLLAQRAR